ncbi:hypothetical protein [Deinococcus aetherius]|nr:hypothetical protein [Deinococcus aetherius]
MKVTPNDRPRTGAQEPVPRDQLWLVRLLRLQEAIRLRQDPDHFDPDLPLGEASPPGLRAAETQLLSGEVREMDALSLMWTIASGEVLLGLFGEERLGRLPSLLDRMRGELRSRRPALQA